MQNCDHYQTDIIKKKFSIVESFFKDKNIDITKSEIKIVTDHLRTAGIIISEGIIPHKNRQGYVLRKIIRTVMEIIFINNDGMIDIDNLLQKFYADDEKSEMIKTIIISEKNSFLENLNKIRNKISNLKMNEKKIKETYGISPGLLKFIRENN